MCRSNCFSLLVRLCLLILPSFVLFPSLSFASFCGKSGVPYSFEVLSNGAPVLGCAQPSCVISATDAEGDFHEDSQFFTNADGQPDGFFRDGDRALKRYRHGTAPKLIANCSGQFSELSCPRKNQWVGGIEYIDHPRQPLILQCCTFEGLRFSQEVGSTTVGPGEAITGGEVVRGGRQISFDVIANVRKVSKSLEGETAGKVRYEVTVRRMNCLPDPPELEVEFDGDVPMEVSKLLGSAKNKEVTDKMNGGGTQQQNVGRKKVQTKQKSRKDDGQPTNAKQTSLMGPRKQLRPQQQHQQQVELQEVTGGEGERPFGRNNEVAIRPNNGQFQQKNNRQQQQQLTNPHQQQQPVQGEQQIFNGGDGQRAQQFIAVQPQQNLGTQFGEQPNQQQFQQNTAPTLTQFAPPQQQQNIGDATSVDQSAPALFTVTPHPFFGTMSFPTLPPHSFPTLPPHSFPTFPPHSFPTLPPHSFPTLPSHSFPTLPPHSFPTFPPHTFPSADAFTPAPAPAGLGSAGGPSGAFAAPTFNAANSGPIPLSSAGGSFGVSQLRAVRQSGFFAGAQPQPFIPQSQADTISRTNQQQQQMPTFQPQNMPQMAPAMGTILAAMQGDRRPIMHPMLGLIGYSNAPQSGKKKK